MKKIVSSVFIVLIAFSLKAQEMVGPYYEGLPVTDTIYTGFYWADGSCPALDVLLMAQQLTPYTSGLDLELHIVNTPNPVLVNDSVVSAGMTFPITQSDFNFGIDFNAAGAFEFAIIASGTPTSSGEEIPCWIDQLQTLSNCDNVWQVFWGESLVPCYVQPSVGIEDQQQSSIKLRQVNGFIEVNSPTSGLIDLIDLNGRKISTITLNSGRNRISVPFQNSTILYRVIADQEISAGKLYLN